MHHVYRYCIPEASPHIRALARAVISLWSSKCLPFPLSHICWTLPRPEAPKSRPWNSLHGWMRRPGVFFFCGRLHRQRIQQPTCIVELPCQVPCSTLSGALELSLKVADRRPRADFYIFPPKLREASWTCNGSWSNSPLFPFGFTPLCKLSVAARRNPLEKTKWQLFF